MRIAKDLCWLGARLVNESALAPTAACAKAAYAYKSMPANFAASLRGAGNTTFTLHSRRLCESFACDIDRKVEELNRMFAEAREELESVREDIGTVYFNDSAEEARGLVDQTLAQWNELLSEVPTTQRESLVRSMGLKMEQLKAEVQELEHAHDD